MNWHSVKGKTVKTVKKKSVVVGDLSRLSKGMNRLSVGHFKGGKIILFDILKVEAWYYAHCKVHKTLQHRVTQTQL